MDSRAKEDGSSRVLIYATSGGRFCIKDTYSVPLDTISKLPGDVLAVMNAVNGLHIAETVKDSEKCAKWCYISLLLGHITPEFVRGNSKVVANLPSDLRKVLNDESFKSFFDALGSLEELYDSFDRHKEGTAHNRMSTVPPGHKITKVFTQSSSCYGFCPVHDDGHCTPHVDVS